MRPTWKGDWFGKGGGGTAWNAFSYDPELNLIYLGVGNGFPYNQQLRSPGGGDNLFLASIVAVNADTGEYVWHYQVCPGRAVGLHGRTGHDARRRSTIDGKPRKVLMQAPKNGFFYVIDAQDRRVHLGREDRQGHLGGADRSQDRPPGREPRHPLSGQAGPVRDVARAARRAQLAAAGVQPDDRPRLYPGDGAGRADRTACTGRRRTSPPAMGVTLIADAELAGQPPQLPEGLGTRSTQKAAWSIELPG